MKKLRELSSKHSYYVPYCLGRRGWDETLEFDSWESFLGEFRIEDLDIDLNMIYRWDIETIDVNRIYSDFEKDCSDPPEPNEFYEEDLLDFLQSEKIDKSISEIKTMNKEDIIQEKIIFYYIHQRKAVLRPVIVYNLKENDETEILSFLKEHKKHLLHYWDLGDDNL